MTVAVCIRCGKTKVGAFTTCLGCRFTPEEPEDLAKSVLLSGQASNRASLNEARATLQAGGSVDLDPQVFADWAAFFRANPQDLGMPLGCLLIWYASLAIMVLLALVLAAVLSYPRWWIA